MRLPSSLDCYKLISRFLALGCFLAVEGGTLAQQPDPPRVIAELPMKFRDNYSPEFSPDGRTLLVTQHSDIILWEVASRQIRGRVRPNKQEGLYYSIQFTTDSRSLIISESYGYSERLFVWDLATEKIVKTYYDKETIGVLGCPTLTPDGRILAVGVSRNFEFWDASTGKTLARLDTNKKPFFFSQLTLSSDGKTLALGMCTAKESFRALRVF